MDEKKAGFLKKRVDAFFNRIQGQYLEEHAVMHAEYCRSKEPVAFKARQKGTYKKIREGQVWGHAWDSAWFKITGTVPKAWAGKQVIAKLNLGGEALVFSDNGEPVFGVTPGSVFTHNFVRCNYPLFKKCKGGERVTLWVEAAANGLFGLNRDADPAEDSPVRYGHYEAKVTDIKLQVMNGTLRHMISDMEVLLSLYDGLPEKSVRRARILRSLSEAINLYADDPANAARVRKFLAPVLACPANASDLRVTAVGHAHIDTGWLWPVRETVRKCARTFSTQIALMEQYPDYVFGASQPQHFAFVKEHYPLLYNKIKKRVNEGRWECQGGMWVEADCNVISGESMVRQFLHGKNFFMDEFGVDVDNLWIPDVFGYSAAMPQILKKCGVDYFVTQKISWNQFNEFPHNTFKWKGIDGSEVLTHFPPENNYNSTLMPVGMCKAQDRFKEKDQLPEFLSLFGIGDGGGGPKDDFIERGLRQRNLEGAPKLKFGTAKSFLHRLDKYADKLETWHGELYLEVHRGTLTTQSRVKRRNRKLELKLRETEALWSCLPLAGYPRKQLDRAWKTVLINQFHDIIPGSSITRVYEQTHREYGEQENVCADLTALAARRLFKKGKDSLVLFNSQSYPYSGAVVLPGSWRGCGVVDAEGVELPVQKEKDGTYVAVNMAPLSFITLKKSGKAKPAGRAKNGLVLENDLVRYTFKKDGTLASCYDRDLKREMLKKPGNVLSLYVDRPHAWDAWDIDITWEEELLQTAKVTGTSGTKGMVRQCLDLQMSIGRSSIRQKIVLSPGSKRLDFITEVDWNEKHKMLRVAFPAAVNTDQAACDIQYGYVNRPTHRNTSWDMAKFEVAAQRYADVSEPGCGLALLNDCKYGHKLVDNVLDLNLLRSSTAPDPDADSGQTHQFTYSLLPHTGDLAHSAVIPAAAALNQPPAVFTGYSAGNAALPAVLEADGISLEVIKKAEKENCHVIRLVETRGMESSGMLMLAGANPVLIETNLMEWTSGKKIAGKREVAIKMKPFEIRTYKLDIGQ